MKPRTETDSDLDAIARRVAPLSPAPGDELDLESLVAWRAGKLDAAETAAVEARLAVDPEARAFVADLAAAPSPFRARWVDRQARVLIARIFTVGSLLAAAAFIIIALLPPAAPPHYVVAVLRGVVTDVRGEAATDRGVSHRLSENARLTLTLAPKEPIADIGAIHARTFTTDGEGHLVAAAAQGNLAEDGSWFLDAPAGELFSDRYGQRDLYITFALDADRLDALAGERPPAGDGAVRVVHLSFEYERRSAR